MASKSKGKGKPAKEERKQERKDDTKMTQPRKSVNLKESIKEHKDDTVHLGGRRFGKENEGTVQHVILHELPQGRREALLDQLVAQGVEFTVDELGGYRSVVPIVLPDERSLLAREELSHDVIKYERPDTATMYLKLKRRYKSFCNSLPIPQAPPRALSIVSTCKTIEEFYAGRFAVEAARLRTQAVAANGNGENQENQEHEEVTCVPFPEFVGIFIRQKYQMSGLSNQACWDIAQSVDHGRSEDPTIELFGRFLDESYDSADMLFFLFAHSVVKKELQQERKGPTDKNTTLGAHQCVRLARAIMDEEHPQLLENLMTRLDGALIKNRAVGQEPYIHSHSFLGLVTSEYHSMRGGACADLDWPVEFETVKPKFKSYLSLPTYEDVPPEPPQRSIFAEHMDKEMQVQVEEMVRHLLASLEDAGHPNPTGASLRQLFEWAVHIVSQRRRIEETFHTRWGMIDPDYVAECLRKVLNNSVAKTVENIVTEMSNNDVAHLEKTEEDALSRDLAERFLPIVENLLQSILERSQQQWMDQLPALEEGDLDADEESAEKHRQRFDHMSTIITKLLMQDITNETVVKICRMITNMDSMSSAVLHRAEERLYDIGCRQRKSIVAPNMLAHTQGVTYSMEAAAKYKKMHETSKGSCPSKSQIQKANTKGLSKYRQTVVAMCKIKNMGIPSPPCGEKNQFEDCKSWRRKK